jgi:transcriptional regulator with XRE-family HTH domain
VGSNTDREVLAELGARLRTCRLARNLTVADVAARAGLNRNTVVNAEAGRNPRLETLVRMLRVYERLEALDGFLAAPEISPLELSKRAGHLRRRARGRHG